MKTFIKARVVLLMALIAISMVSCVKSDLPSSNSYNAYSLMERASITDMGLVNDSTREMLVILNGQEYALTNKYGTFIQSGTVIQVEMFSNQDEIIPSGEYTCSDSTRKIPFTFSDSYINVGGGFIGITNGSITVSSIGPTYTLIFKCGLSDGESFTATYNGAMMYTDYFN